ncbi:MAG: phosphotransferase [Bacteroidetes bacterium]|nr:phosphotransferase [Bacteroidota bacterium]
MNIEEKISRLYREWSGSDALKMEKIAGTGSYRQYFRITGASGNVVAAFNADVRENLAFLKFSRHFKAMDLPVPRVLYTGPDSEVYLLEDLGDTTLYSALTRLRIKEKYIHPDIVKVYLKVVELLPKFQVIAGDSIPFNYCYPRPAFDRQSMMWDLNYFKYYFLKLARISFDEQKLEEDFNAFTGFLLEVPAEHFMYRDFQSRNIMIHNNTPWFIDYQGGRKGALQYDLASLLYDAKADLPEDFRDQLLTHYIKAGMNFSSSDETRFRKYFDGFVLIRILQAMGAYGFRGYYENKPLFLQSIPFAVKNLKILRERALVPVHLPMLMQALDEIIGNPVFSSIKAPQSDLTVRIFSFSYKKDLPADESGNGGGFVFDCRALPNPGRYPEYGDITGKDKLVIDFLRKEPEVDAFLNHVFSLVSQSVRNYIDRGFASLMVSFGCTGGQHRSVYSAEELAKYLKEKFNVKVEINHSYESNDPGSGLRNKA